MDVAKNFASWRDQSPEQWIARANQVLPPIVIALLVVVIAYQAASLTRRLLEAPAEQTGVPVAAPAATVASPTPANSYQALNGWKPFGEPPAAGTEIQQTALTDLDNVPQTSLPHRLWGTNGANRDESASAAIAASERGSQFTYFVGDTIEGANGAKLDRVFPTEVILLFPDGHREKLSLPDADQLASAARGSGRRLTTSSSQQQPTLQRAVQMQTAMTNAAPLLQENVRITPHLEGGQTIGWRLQPANNPELFAEIGFEPGDVLMEVNGIRLTDPANGALAFAALSEASQAQATVQRNGERQTIVVDLTSIQRMMESRQ